MPFPAKRVVSISQLSLIAMTRFFLLLLISFIANSLIFAQHDIQRNAVQKIAKGKYGEAAKILTGTKKPDAGTAETLFVEMLSLLHQNKTEAALSKAREAVKAGLPFERLLAGPPSLMPQLHELGDFQAWKNEANPSALVAGPMLGRVTDASASFWLRTDGEAVVKIGASWKSGLDNDIRTSTATTTAEQNFTTVITLENLEAGRRYTYGIEVSGKTTATGIFRTSPQTNTPAKFSVAFGGGAGFIPEWERMWATIGEKKPAALLMLGDNVYIDQPEESVTNFYCYMRRQARPEWRRLISKTPVYSIWDDHDFGDNDCVPGPEIEKPAWKRKVWDIFRQNWVNPSYGGGESQPGCWYDFHIGDVHFIMLDGRYYRDLKGGTMLGPVQKKWFLETLRNSSGTFKVITSPVPFTAGIKPGSRDPWDGYPEEREEIFSFIETENIEGVFLIAADRHRTDLRITTRSNGYNLYEFESSRLTNRHTHSVVQTEGLVWGYSKKCSFGLMKFDTTAADPQVIFEGVNIDGQTVGEFVLKRSMLKK